MTQPAPLAAALRAHARGLYCLEAATDLLIGQATWLHRSDFTTSFVTVGPSLLDGFELAVIDWPTAITSLETGHLPCSGGEGQILRIAASLAHGIPLDLRDNLTGLDPNNIDLVCRAVLHTSGHRQDPAE
jgi:hypothetical protein